jgi:predicted DNA-binding transcriptional regulator AlpA
MKITINGEEYIGQNDVLKRLKMKRHILYNKIKQGDISSPLKPDERAFWKRSEIDEYLERTREK